jgi:hypothetical protein
LLGIGLRIVVRRSAKISSGKFPRSSVLSERSTF